MSIYIRPFLALYQRDNRMGNGLISPQNWCNSRWGKIVSPLDQNHSYLWQVATRTTEAFLLLLPTIISYTLGFIGIIIKACQQIPTENLFLGGTSFLGEIDPAPLPVARPVPIDLYYPWRPNRQSRCTIHDMALDVMLRIATFLRPRKQFQCMLLSKRFTRVMNHHSLWHKYVVQYRLWGATSKNFSFIYGNKKRSIFSGWQREQSEPLKQIKAYYALRKEYGNNEVINYLARLMPGGPEGFCAIPQQSGINLDRLTGYGMVAPIVRGKDCLSREFFAMRVMDRSIEGEPIALVFVCDTSRFGNRWIQKANPYWIENTLQLPRTETLRYILMLFWDQKWTGNSEFTSPIFKKTVEIV